MKHVIHLLPKAHLSVYTDNDLNFTDPWNTDWICILSRGPVVVMGLRPGNRDGATGLRMTITTTPHIT